ncbi:hypothetical protein AGMMS49960_13070 [Betaproteobacteria bacterium]|nr:hypothetical protein AGMMS49543_20630 [Betaproteobacteria bacterium]GHU01906.1 hypothetical protein AGMMS49960_13070 [Betaproteobacteria bacterium]GHU17445.1 hypothetical protein AGMMS50243_05690 [Betaproteobacteria bacterium]
MAHYAQRPYYRVILAPSAITYQHDPHNEFIPELLRGLATVHEVATLDHIGSRRDMERNYVKRNGVQADGSRCLYSPLLRAAKITAAANCPEQLARFPQISPPVRFPVQCKTLYFFVTPA